MYDYDTGHGADHLEVGMARPILDRELELGISDGARLLSFSIVYSYNCLLGATELYKI